MKPDELKGFYDFLKSELKMDIGADAYRALFEGCSTYYGYPFLTEGVQTPS